MCVQSDSILLNFKGANIKIYKTDYYRFIPGSVVSTFLIFSPFFISIFIYHWFRRNFSKIYGIYYVLLEHINSVATVGSCSIYVCVRVSRVSNLEICLRREQSF